jgi:hypothetical protein
MYIVMALVQTNHVIRHEFDYFMRLFIAIARTLVCTMGVFLCKCLVVYYLLEAGP